VSAAAALASPRCIKASHRRRRRIASGHFVQRYYDPQIGRFLSVDPVTADANTGAMFNRYNYAYNNSYKFVDPDGRYGRGAGWSTQNWNKFNRAQTGAAGKLERAAGRLNNALATGQGMKGVAKSFERTFGAGSATPKNMSAVASKYTEMAGALRDDGSRGYIATGQTMQQMSAKINGDATNVAAAAVHGGKDIYVNTGHSKFSNHSQLTKVTAHESSHNFGLRDQSYGGFKAYSAGGENEKKAFRDLPSEQRLINPDHLVDFAR
jgi:RHS repeat-associated protein